MNRYVPLMWMAATLPLLVLAAEAFPQANLLPNGGFEKDENGNGIPDGWRMQAFNVSNESLEDVTPVPAGLSLGKVTCVVSSTAPFQQVVSEPVEVKPETGYRLSYWFRMSGGWSTVVFQIIDAGAPLEDAWPKDKVLSGKGLGWAWVPRWTRFEIPFRTGNGQRAIRLRLWKYPSEGGARRLWYDDFKLVEDNSVVVGNITEGGGKEPAWPKQVADKGYVVVGRPAYPMTSHKYMPTLAELTQPLRLTLAAGETGSAVVFVRSLGEAITVRASAPGLVSAGGYGLDNSYGARHIWLRAAEETKLGIDAQRYLMRPEYLLYSRDLSLAAKDGGQFWLTISAAPGTPAGEYSGELTVTPIDPKSGGAKGKETRLPVILTVRPLDLAESDVAFGTWYHTSPMDRAAMTPPFVLPGADEIYLADQRRHGMNTVGNYCKTERKDKDGGLHLTFNELDTMVANVRRAGLCTKHPMLLLTWSDVGVGGGFGCLGGREQAVMDIYHHAKRGGWPEILFYVLDEPSGGDRARRVEEAMKYYTPARAKGVRTVTAGPDPYRQGKYYDVWIESMYISNWAELHGLARKHKTELWMYDCSLTGKNPVLERFYAGLWTWRTGVRGNMVWSYGWYVRMNESALPESKLAWEGRLCGVNDYRYLHTLETQLSRAKAAGKGGAAPVKQAFHFLDDLRARIPLDVYEARPHGPDQYLWNPVPKIGVEDYDRIRNECADHIKAVDNAIRQ